MNTTDRDLPELLRDMPLFVEVAKHKSFTLAAESLDMYISTLSRRISLLESRLGVPLFLRSTRNVELTESGKVFYDRCRYLLAETENIYEEVARNMTRAAGPVRIAIPADVYHTYMWGIAGQFAKKWPEINLVISFMPRWVDLITEPFDLDIRVGKLPDSDFVARKLISLEPGLYASKSFLEKYGIPSRPKELKELPCITLPQQGNVWTMHMGKKKESVSINAVHMVNSISLALDLAMEGCGITWLAPAILKHPEMKENDLVHILPEWSVPGIELNIVMPNRQLPYRVRLFVDHLVEHFAKMPQ